MSTVATPFTDGTDDAALVVACRSGDDDAAAAFVARFRTRVVRHLRRTVAFSRPDDAEDLAQEAITKALRSLDRFDVDAPLWPWLRRLAENTARDHYRLARHRREIVGPAEALAANLSPAEDHAERLAQQDQVRRVLDALPRHHRDVIVQVTLNDVPQRQAASSLGISYAALRKRLGRAHAAFRTTYETLGALPVLRWVARVGATKSAGPSLLGAGLFAVIPTLIIAGLAIIPDRAGGTVAAQDPSALSLPAVHTPLPAIAQDPDTADRAAVGLPGPAVPTVPNRTTEEPTAPGPQGIASDIRTPDITAPVGGVRTSSSFEDGPGYTVYSVPATDIDGSGPLEVSNDSEEVAPIHDATCASVGATEAITCRQP